MPTETQFNIVPIVEPGYVVQEARELVTHPSGSRVSILHARPVWTGPNPVLVKDAHGKTQAVRIAQGVSQLAILDAYANLNDDEYLVVLTDRTRDDLGDAVLLRALGRDLRFPDAWATVPKLFGAATTSRTLRRVGNWVPNALLAHAPASGWPASPGPEVTDIWALGNLINRLLNRSLPDNLDADIVLAALGESATHQAWRSVDRKLRENLIDWAEQTIGTVVAFALRVGASSTRIAPIAVGLAVDLLWNTEMSAVERGIAQEFISANLLDRGRLDADSAREIGLVSRGAILRWLREEPATALALLQQTEALLSDAGWEAGAQTSDLLPSGLAARLRAFSGALGSVETAEAAFEPVAAHLLADESAEVETARMALRLVRWLNNPAPPLNHLDESISRYVADGGWVERAVGFLWNASDDPKITANYRDLIARVNEQQNLRDRAAADQLAAYTSWPKELGGVIPVERILEDLVRPWSRTGGVLLVVLDGMSMAVATAVVEEATRLGFSEYVPSSGAAAGHRLSALAALPSLTNISRGSMLSGTLTVADAAAEKQGFARVFSGAPLFHKDDLRSEAGETLPIHVRSAISDLSKLAVGVVINAIDDTLHKQDTNATNWTLDRLAPLEALLRTAAAAGRTVILTSDHGNIVERATDALPAHGGGSRWRANPAGSTQESGTLAPGLVDGEVAVSGSRVLTDNHSAVLLWRQDAHYGPRYPGYHGGASLAEITVPIIVLRPRHLIGSVLDGWDAAPPQAPEWWNEKQVTNSRPVLTSSVERKQPTASARQSRPITELLFSAGGEGMLFSMERHPPAVSISSKTDLGNAVVTSAIYDEQRSRLRRVPPDGDVQQFINTLAERGGRAHRDTVAAALSTSPAVFGGVFATIQRLLNVDAYPVISLQDDGLTVALDDHLLREQFGIGD